MARETKLLADLRWPASVRLPVLLTFEHQSGEGAPLLPGERPNAMIGGAMEYGARTGIWNILELLDRFSVRSTFFVSGSTAEKYPDAVRAAHAAGHEIAGMGHSFERVRTMASERERAVVRRTANTLYDICGAAVIGWRCPDYRVSPQTLDILSQEGMKWDSSMLNDDLPCLFDCASGKIVELPFTTSTADKTFIGYPYPVRSGPDGLADIWASEFDVLYRESIRAARFLILSIQTWATGRPAPLRSLRRFIERTLQYNDVQFMRAGDLVAWCTAAATAQADTALQKSGPFQR